MRAILIVRDKVTTGQRPCPQTTTFEGKGEPKRYQTEVLTAHQPTALPLGQTGSQNKLWCKKYGAASSCFHSCANKETTDHYSQSRCANKNPQATICTAALPIRLHVGSQWPWQGKWEMTCHVWSQWLWQGKWEMSCHIWSQWPWQGKWDIYMTYHIWSQSVAVTRKARDDDMSCLVSVAVTRKVRDDMSFLVSVAVTCKARDDMSGLGGCDKESERWHVMSSLNGCDKESEWCPVMSGLSSRDKESERRHVMPGLSGCDKESERWQSRLVSVTVTRKTSCAWSWWLWQRKRVMLSLVFCHESIESIRMTQDTRRLRLTLSSSVGSAASGSDDHVSSVWRPEAPDTRVMTLSPAVANNLITTSWTIIIRPKLFFQYNPVTTYFLTCA